MRAARWLAPLVLCACNANTVQTATQNVLRAVDVAFVCLDVRADGQGLVRAEPLSRCAINSDNSSASGSLRLHALMIQQTRGELAVVDLAATSGSALLDNVPSVPGYSFLPTVALPTAVLVDVRGEGDPNPSAPPVVWIASASQGRIQRIDARGLRRDPTQPAPVLSGTFEVEGDPQDLAVDTVAGRRVLYATLPSQGAVATFDVTDPANVVPLGRVSLSGAQAADGGVARLRPSAITLDPRTHRLFVSDDGSPVVHVLEGFPLRETGTIPFGVRTRSLALTGWARPGTPVTPVPTVPVPRETCDPATDPDHCGFAQYLYAVSSDDGSVHVWDLTRGARVRPNLRPSPNPTGRRIDPSLSEEQVPLPAAATAVIALNTAEYDAVTDPLDPSRVVVNAAAPCERTPRDCSVRPTLASNILRGVFVGAVLRNGTLSFIDVDDYDAACRALNCASESATASRSAYRHVRHATRANGLLVTPPRLIEAPKVTALSGATLRVDLTGRTAPVIACTPTRDLSERYVCPTASDGAASDDPNAANLANYGVSLRREDAADGTAGRLIDAYAARNEQWTLTWEGAIPALDQEGGALTVDGERVRLDAPGAFFCARGALAQDDARDQVTIVGDPVPLAADRTLCRELFGTAALALNRDFVLESAHQARLSLRMPEGITADSVVRCFPQATRFRVRTRNQWLAVGSRTGYLHDVRAAADGRCEIDPQRGEVTARLATRCVGERFEGNTARRCPAGRVCMAETLTMRAVAAASSPVFANPFLCLQVFPPLVERAGQVEIDVVPRDAQITFAVTNAFEPITAPIVSGNARGGSLPVAMRFLPSVNRLYVVDTGGSGLLEFLMNPLSSGRIFN